MSRSGSAAIFSALVCACGSFDSAPSTSTPTPSADGGVGDAATVNGAGFCPSRSGFDLCADFDDATKSPTAGWDAFNLPNGAPPTIDQTTFRSAPSSLRIDVPGPMLDLGLRKSVGPGTVYHVEAAVQIDPKPADEFVEIIRVELATPAGTYNILADLQPTSLHIGFCPEDYSLCDYGNASYDFHEWRTISVDVDATKSKGSVIMKVGDAVIKEGTLPASNVDSMLAVIGPRESAADNAIVFRLDDILISHR